MRCPPILLFAGDILKGLIIVVNFQSLEFGAYDVYVVSLSKGIVSVVLDIKNATTL